jgi:hypothetical protein
MLKEISRTASCVVWHIASTSWWCTTPIFAFYVVIVDGDMYLDDGSGGGDESVDGGSVYIIDENISGIS